MTTDPTSTLAPPAGRTRVVATDAVCAEAVEVARQAAVDVAGAGAVGEHLGLQADAERIVTHAFASLAPGYVGWYWAVTVARVSRSKTVTVDEVCLLPGDGALVAPAWVPYADRLRPDDLGPGDLLATEPDDDRLEPGWTGGVDARTRRGSPDDIVEVAHDLGLARPRVLSLIGLDDAADRWVNGEGGPQAPIAQSAPARCVSCGFMVKLNGLLGQGFGVCANEYSPSDGTVITLDHGCGAHSEAIFMVSLSAAGAPVLDEVGYDEFTELGHG